MHRMHWYHSNVADDTYGDSGGSITGTAALHMMSGLVGAFHVLPEDDQVLPLEATSNEHH